MNQRIIVCGAGTLGGTLCEHLARVGCLALTAIDDDRVETRNLQNQPYQRKDVGQPKVRALADLLYRNTAVDLVGKVKRLTGHTVQALLAEADIVVDAFDNHASRQVLAEHCRSRDLPCLHIGLSHQGYAEVMWNETYRVPPDVAGDACLDPMSRTLALLVVSVASESLRAYVTDGRRRNFTITLQDLAILEV